jgi:hypothetical protein
MQMLSEDDRNVRDMTDEELALAWDLWFDLAQVTNEFDPPYTHGVFAGIDPEPREAGRPAPEGAR